MRFKKASRTPHLILKDLFAKDIMSKNPKVMKGNYLASFALQQMENLKSPL